MVTTLPDRWVMSSPQHFLKKGPRCWQKPKMALLTSKTFCNQILQQHITLGHLHKIMRKKLFCAKKVTTLPALTVRTGYLILMDPESDPGGPKTSGSGSPTLLVYNGSYLLRPVLCVGMWTERRRPPRSCPWTRRTWGRSSCAASASTTRITWTGPSRTSNRSNLPLQS